MRDTPSARIRHCADITMFYAARGGGIRRYLDAKRAWLLQRGLAHTLVVPRSNSEPHGASGLASVPVPGACGYRIPLSSQRAERLLIARAPDVIEVADVFHLAWAALRAARRLRVSAVAYCHSDVPTLVRTTLGAGAARLAEAYVCRVLRSFSLVLAPNRRLTERLVERGVTTAQCRPLGVDLTAFNPARRNDVLRRNLRLSDRTRLMVYAGRFAPEKDIAALSALARRLGSGYALVLIGSGSALPRELPANVRVMPYEPDRLTLASHLASADVFVHAGAQETFGLSALEAMACGTPVAAFQSDGLAEMVKGGAGILVAPGDVEALAQAVSALCGPPSDETRKQARAVAEGYGWDAVFEALLALYGTARRAQ